MTARPPTPPSASFTKELRDTQKSAKALLKVIDSEAVRDLGVNEEAVQALEEFTNAKIPTARALARAALVGAIPNEGIYLLWNRARKAFMAAGPAIMDMFLEKMELGHNCKYSERLLVEAMKGTGMLTAGEPVSNDDRAAMISSDELRELSDDELRQQLHDTVRGEDDG